MRSTHGADRVLGRLVDELLAELARQAVAKRLVRMHRVVVLEPAVELAQHAGGVGPRADARVVAFEGFHEGLSHAVDCGLSIGVVHGTKPISRTSLRVSLAV